MFGNNQNRSVSRRNVLKFGAGMLGTGALGIALGTETVAPRRAIANEDLTPDQAIDLLMEGNRRFVEHRQSHPHQDVFRMTEVATGQKPFAAILGCADSRVPTELVFDQGLGDLFVCRVAGNVAIDEQIASLEYGTLVLGSKVIMVVGHERCGAVTAALDAHEVPGRISTLISAIHPALEGGATPYSDLEAATKANILYQVEQVKASPVIAQLIQENKLKVIGSYYDLDTGVVTLL